MVCPECGGKTKVIKTAKYKKSVLRERICRNCRYKIYTTETESDYLVTRRQLNHLAITSRQNHQYKSEESEDGYHPVAEKVD